MSTLLTFRTGTGINSYVVHVSNDDRFPQTISTTTGTSWYVTTGARCWIDTISYKSGYSGARAKCSANGNDWSLTTDNTVGTSTTRNITVYASSTPSYTSNPIYFRTGTGVSSYTMQYANSTSTGLTDSITGRDSSTTLYVRDSTNASLLRVSYESGYGEPYYFVEYTSSSFSTVKKTFTEGYAYVYSSGIQYIKLFATKQITYVSVKYYKNGGTWSSGSDPYTDTIESGSYSGTATPSGRVSRTNYRLLGWSTSSTATSATYGTNEAIGPLGTNLTLYAVWQELPYITLDAGEGRFGTDRYAYFHIDYGGYVYFNRYTPTRDGYTLIGWSATQGATSPTYGPSDAVGPLYGSTYKYYAVWQKSTATITLNGNGGLWDASTGILSVTLDVGDTLLFSKYSSLTREGYKHIGWSTSASATSAAWGVNGSVTVGATDATYYAVWQKSTAKITLNGNGGLWDASTGIITLTMNIGDTLLFSKYASLTRAGYTHLGWSTSSGATSAAWDVDGYVTVGSTDSTYYAVWQKKSIALFYWQDATWDPANMIKGKPISNLTATRWNNLLAKVEEVVKASGGSGSLTGVTSGSPILASTFNGAINVIKILDGYGTLPSTQNPGNEIKASLFEGSVSLKSALNTAITHYNTN